MPVKKCSNGKWRIGSGDCQYDTKEDAESAYAGYRASKHSESVEEQSVTPAEGIRYWIDRLNKNNG